MRHASLFWVWSFAIVTTSAAPCCQNNNKRKNKMTYDSYEAAKIANPYSAIYASKMAANGAVEIFGVLGAIAKFAPNYYRCDPSKYCMTVENFLADWYEFVEGDLILDECLVYTVTDCKTQEYRRGIESVNKLACDDDSRYVLRAAALKPRDNDCAMSVMEKKVEVEQYD